MEYVFQSKNLCKYYGNQEVLKEINIDIPQGSIYGLIGKNGSGKTTLFRIIAGIQAPSSDRYTLFGIKNTDKDIIYSRKRVGALIECAAICPYMSAEDNLKYQYILCGLPSFDGLYEILKLVGLENSGNKKARYFSLGMRQRLGIALALVGNPDFLIFDEPLNGIDANGIVAIRELIIKLNRDQHITFLISSHILSEISKIATHYGFIDDGKIIKQITAEEFERERRKSMKIEVSDTKMLACVLDNINVEYKIISDTLADVFGDITVYDIVSALEKQNCHLISIQKNDETLESYYINLLGEYSNE